MGLQHLLWMQPAALCLSSQQAALWPAAGFTNNSHAAGRGSDRPGPAAHRTRCVRHQDQEHTLWPEGHPGTVCLLLAGCMSLSPSTLAACATVPRGEAGCTAAGRIDRRGAGRTGRPAGVGRRAAFFDSSQRPAGLGTQSQAPLTHSHALELPELPSEHIHYLSHWGCGPPVATPSSAGRKRSGGTDRRWR